MTSLTKIAIQLEEKNTSLPLLPDDPMFLSRPVDNSVVKTLCVNPRESWANKTDLWGDTVCDYYEEIEFGTPENGVFLFSFLKGLLGLNVNSNSSLILLGNAANCGSNLLLSLPTQWPQEVRSVGVNGLNVGMQRNVGVSCTVANFQLQCNVTCLSRGR